VQPLQDDDSRVTLLLADRQLRVPARLEAVIQHVAALEDEERFRPVDLAAWLDPQSRVVLTRRLVREGFLRVAG
jgi:pyridoxine/pyridoxamine 5'-phosphate oxidase